MSSRWRRRRRRRRRSCGGTIHLATYCGSVCHAGGCTSGCTGGGAGGCTDVYIASVASATTPASGRPRETNRVGRGSVAGGVRCGPPRKKQQQQRQRITDSPVKLQRVSGVSAFALCCLVGPGLSNRHNGTHCRGYPLVWSDTLTVHDLEQPEQQWQRCTEERTTSAYAMIVCYTVGTVDMNVYDA